MKGNFAAKARQVVLALLVVPFISEINGIGFFGGGGCCPTAVGCAPFDCGALNFEFKAGVAPKVWTDRGCIFGVDCRIPSPRGPFIELGRIPKFHCLHKVPWTVGFKLGYMMSCHAEVFLEFQYFQANFKCFDFFGRGFNKRDGDKRDGDSHKMSGSRDGSHSFSSRDNQRRFNFDNFSRLKEFAGYLGTRYYCDRWFCNTTSWFFGSKVGVSHHRARCFNFRDNNRHRFNDGFDGKRKNNNNNMSNRFSRDNRIRRANFDLFDDHTSVSGGVHTGVDVRVWCDFSFVFTAEVVATCGPRGNHNARFFDRPGSRWGSRHISIGSVGTEVTFPITFGLQYSF
jgi:hypothetical protein